DDKSLKLQISTYQSYENKILKSYYRDELLEFYCENEIPESQNLLSNTSYLQMFADQHYQDE
ncbi:16504_t:CDS:1, partial [Racocetra persica]